MVPQHSNRPQGLSLYVAPGAMALFAVSLVLGLLALEDPPTNYILQLSEPTLRAFLASHLFHTGGYHLALDLLVLLVAGGVLEMRWGTLRFVTFYLFCVWSAAGLSLLLALAFPQEMVGPACGSSSAALGCLVALGLLYPDHRLVRAAPPAKHLAWFLILTGSAGLAALQRAEGLILLPQVSGVAFSMLLIRLNPCCERLVAHWRDRRERERVIKVREIRKRVDDLLAKISSHGADSLTREEKAFLERASKLYRSSAEN